MSSRGEENVCITGRCGLCANYGESVVHSAQRGNVKTYGLLANKIHNPNFLTI